VDRNGLFGAKLRRRMIPKIGRHACRSDERLCAGGGGALVGGEGALESPSAFKPVASHVPELREGSSKPQGELSLA